jgi:general secretion pathway protein G
MSMSQSIERITAALRAELSPDRMKRRARRGMSLLEVMVVIAIILTLMGVLAFGVMSVFGDSQVQTTILTMNKVDERVQIYMLRKKKPPSTSDGLEAVYGKEGVPTDAWGNEIKYVQPGGNGRKFDLISFGPDGVEGGGDDIVLSEQG